jgi:hypothetical protein
MASGWGVRLRAGFFAWRVAGFACGSVGRKTGRRPAPDTPPRRHSSGGASSELTEIICLAAGASCVGWRSALVKLNRKRSSGGLCFRLSLSATGAARGGWRGFGGPSEDAAQPRPQDGGTKSVTGPAALGGDGATGSGLVIPRAGRTRRSGSGRRGLRSPSARPLPLWWCRGMSCRACSSARSGASAPGGWSR